MFALYSLPPSKRQKSRKVDRDLCTKTKETGFLRFLRAVTGLFVHQTRFLTSPGCTPTLLPKKPGCWAPIVSPKPLTRRPFHVTPTQNVKVEMVYSLAAIVPIVNHNSIAVAESELFSYPFDSQQQVSHESMIS
jgi:hypothetical protein